MCIRDRAYTDLCLMTADAGLGAETARVFTALSCGETMEECEHLMVAPHCLQNQVLELIGRETAKGENGYIGAKINSLTDKDIIKALIAASKAGVTAVSYTHLGACRGFPDRRSARCAPCPCRTEAPGSGTSC